MLANNSHKYSRSGLLFSVALSIMHFPLLSSICAYILDKHNGYLHLSMYSFFAWAFLLAITGTGLLAYSNYAYIRKMKNSENKKYNVFLLLSINISLLFLILNSTVAIIGDAGMLWAAASSLMFLPWLIFMLCSASSHLIQCVDFQTKLPPI